MADLADRIRIRVLPALLTALGVAGLAGGLMSLTSPVTADPLPSPSPTIVASAEPTRTPLITFPPLPSDAAPSTSPPPPADRVATRVRIAALKIDLPVVKPPVGADAYPLCDVAMYIQELGQPGQGRATYLYAHARAGMFLPILDASLVQNGKQMLGMVVELWTSDDQRFLYEITEVRRHQLDLDDAINASSEELWLQTSEGPKGTPGKTQVIALPISQEAADPAEAHPEPKPLVCG
ncbi:MAG: hypothetical protein Q7S35_04855 [Candidatus Limnocylindrales bacterium]|nr:hypothetical protein [Candidatus Limnocylindrales bacterium]